MSNELSLESIKKCLVMEEKELECIEMIIHPDTEAFLKKEKENQDSSLQKLKQEKQSIENFLESIGSEERAEARLNNAIVSVKVKEQEYNIAQSRAEEAAQTYNDQVNYINGLQNQLVNTQDTLHKLDPCGCMSTEAKSLGVQSLAQKLEQLRLRQNLQQILQQKKALQELKVSLAQARKDLDTKNLDKINKEQIKTKGQVELEKLIELKNQAEKDFKIIKENQVKIEVSDAKMKLAQEESVKAQDMLRELSKQAYEIENDVDLDVKTYEEGPNDELKRNILDSPIVNEDTLEQQYEL